MSYVLTRGFGDASTAQIVGQVGSVGAAGVTAALPLLGLSNLVPIVGPILGGLLMGAQALIADSGCGITCVETSQWANKAAAQLDQMIHAYFALPTPRPKSAQTLYLQAFNGIWQTLAAQCGQPGTGNAGVRCITDRQAGACTWHQPAASVPPWGTPPAGSCWNWFNGYRDPVANDPNVYDDTVAPSISDTASSAVSDISAAASSLPSWWPLAAIAAVALAVAA